MRFSFCLPGLAVAAALTACDSTRETTTGQPNPATASARVPASAEPAGFRKELVSGPYTYVVSTSGPVGKRQLAVRAEQAGRELTTALDTVRAEVQQAVLAKLTTGPGDELLVLTGGKDVTGAVYGFWFGGQDWERMEPLPPLAGPAAQGYQGRDRFEVRGSTLLREFPVYLPADAPCCPSGGVRTISYRMQEGSLRFRAVAVVNEPKADM